MPPDPLTAVDVVADEDKLLRRDITLADVWSVLGSGPRVLRNKRVHDAAWAVIGRDRRGRTLRLNVYWRDESQRILRVTSGWPV